MLSPVLAIELLLCSLFNVLPGFLAPTHNLIVHLHVGRGKLQLGVSCSPQQSK